MTDREQTNVDRTATRVVEALTGILGDSASSNLVSAAEKIGDAAFVSLFAWERAGGFGIGGGEGGEPGGSTGFGAGGGGGGASQGRPVAVVRVSPDGVEVKPVIDFTKVGITALLSAIGLWRALRR